MSKWRLQVLLVSVVAVVLAPSYVHPEDDDDFLLFEDETPEIHDPWIGYNKAITRFNDKAYEWTIRPITYGYIRVFPQPVRTGINNAFDNILFPTRFLNNLFQAKWRGAKIEATRFVVNSTLGILGVMDPAYDWLKLEAHNEDFGQTLATWGFGPGPYIVWPFLGPSNVRDSFGIVGDYFSRPITYTRPILLQYSLESARFIAGLSTNIETLDKMRAESIDFYSFARDFYYQNRQSRIDD